MTNFDAATVEAELSAYYDTEGDERSARPVDPRRAAARESFLASLSGNSRRVLEVGCGPGRDASAFIDAGHEYIAVDLSIEPARRCSRVGGEVALASVRCLPFRPGSFDAIWTMSTLMHVPDSAIESALAEVRRALVVGGVAAIGVWGGPDVESYSDESLKGRPSRLFSRRSAERWRSMLAAIGTVMAFETWGEDADFPYQLALVRKDAAA